jgi:GxxExxY protein
MVRTSSRKGYEFERLSYAVIGVCINVQRQLGMHCKEEDYQRAISIGLSQRGIHFEKEAPIPVTYQGIEVTERRVDFRIWDSNSELLLEIKARNTFLPKDHEQCLLYLSQGRYQLCLLVNFGEVPLGIKRLVYTTRSETEGR